MRLDFSDHFKWDKAQNDSSKLSKAMRPLAEKLAEEYLQLLKKNISKNTYGFPISDSSRALKIRQGKALVPLIYTGEYLDSIYRDGTVVKVAEGKHSNGLTFAELSFLLEHGRRDKNIRACPVWSRTFEDFSPRIKDAYTKELQKYFRRNPIFVGFPKLKKGRI